MLWKTIGKLFAHGFLFAVIFGALIFGWFFFTFLLVSIGYILGLVIGFALLFLAVGYINRWLAAYLWGIEGATSTVYCFLHGLLLSVFVIVVNFLFVVLPSLIWSGWVTWIIAFSVGAFLNGAVGREVASWFRRPPGTPSEEYVGE